MSTVAFFSVVDVLILDVNVIDQRVGAFFSTHAPDTQMYEAISHFAHFDLHSTRPISLAASFTHTHMDPVVEECP